MPTFLEVANECLLLVGEREVTAFNNPPARKARLALLRAVNLCHQLHSWRFLRQSVQTSTLSQWVGNVATIVAFRDVLGVYSGTTQLRQTNPQAIRRETVQGLVLGVPQYYSALGENTVSVFPNPSDTAKLAMVFDIVAQPTLPSLPGDEFAYPVYFTSLCKVYAQYVLHLTHTTDMASADATQREFELLVHMTRTNDSLLTISNMSA